MIYKQQEGVHWLEFELLSEAPIVHGCLMRHGGVSSGQLSSLNLGRNVGDDPGNVRANYEKLAKIFSFKNVITGRLSHGANVTRLISPAIQEMPISDSLTTSLPNVAIAMTQADCQAAIFYDPIRHAMANVHCGWRSSTQNIYEATVRRLQADYGSKPADLLVCVSPSLGPDHAEFIHYKKELPVSFWQFKVKDDCFDFWAISRWQLENAGVLPHHIQIACVDTYSTPDYFSHRRSMHFGDSKEGRQATFCSLT